MSASVKAALTAAFLSSGSNSLAPFTEAMAPVLADMIVTFSGRSTKLINL